MGMQLPDGRKSRLQAKASKQPQKGTQAGHQNIGSEPNPEGEASPDACTRNPRGPQHNHRRTYRKPNVPIRPMHTLIGVSENPDAKYVQDT